MIGLTVVSIAAIACAAAGPQWATYVGFVLVIGALAWSTWSSWREIDALRAAHAEQVKALRDQMRATSHEHHTEMMELVSRFAARTNAHKVKLAELGAALESERGLVAQLRTELGERSDELAAATKKVVALELQIVTVEEQLAVATVELENLAATADADLVQLPRQRSRREQQKSRGAQRRQA